VVIEGYFKKDVEKTRLLLAKKKRKMVHTERKESSKGEKKEITV